MSSQFANTYCEFKWKYFVLSIKNVLKLAKHTSVCSQRIRILNSGSDSKPIRIRLIRVSSSRACRSTLQAETTAAVKREVERGLEGWDIKCVVIRRRARLSRSYQWSYNVTSLMDGGRVDSSASLRDCLCVLLSFKSNYEWLLWWWSFPYVDKWWTCSWPTHFHMLTSSW